MIRTYFNVKFWHFVFRIVKLIDLAVYWEIWQFRMTQLAGSRKDTRRSRVNYVHLKRDRIPCNFQCKNENKRYNPQKEIDKCYQGQDSERHSKGLRRLQWVVRKQQENRTYYRKWISTIHLLYALLYRKIILLVY